MTPGRRGSGNLALACPNPRIQKTLDLTSPFSGVIIGSLDILVDIGVPAEKEVIQ
jgi:hypothetical protein